MANTLAVHEAAAEAGLPIADAVVLATIVTDQTPIFALGIATLAGNSPGRHHILLEF